MFNKNNSILCGLVISCILLIYLHLHNKNTYDITGIWVGVSDDLKLNFTFKKDNTCKFADRAWAGRKTKKVGANMQSQR